MRGRVVERRVRIEAEGLAGSADLLELAFALGNSGACTELHDVDDYRWGLVLAALERFLASTLERVFRDAHIGLWEEYAAGERPGPEGGEPVGVYLSLVMGDQEEVLVQVPGIALASPENDPEQQRDLSKGLRAMADELDRMADREEQRQPRPDPAAALRGEARLMRFLHGED